MQDELLQPGFSIVEGVLISDIEDDAGGLRESEVVVDDSAISFLSCGVPEF